MRRPYRCVEVAVAVHGDIQPRLGALDGNDPEPHRNQVELHCKKKTKRGCYCSFFGNSQGFLILIHPPPPPPGVLCSAYLSKVRMRCVCKRRGRGRGALGGILGGGRGEQGGKKEVTEKKKRSDRMENFCLRERGRREIWRNAQQRQ